MASPEAALLASSSCSLPSLGSSSEPEVLRRASRTPDLVRRHSIISTSSSVGPLSRSDSALSLASAAGDGGPTKVGEDVGEADPLHERLTVRTLRRSASADPKKMRREGTPVRHVTFSYQEGANPPCGTTTKAAPPPRPPNCPPSRRLTSMSPTTRRRSSSTERRKSLPVDEPQELKRLAEDVAKRRQEVRHREEAVQQRFREEEKRLQEERARADKALREQQRMLSRRIELEEKRQRDEEKRKLREVQRERRKAEEESRRAQRELALERKAVDEERRKLLREVQRKEDMLKKRPCAAVRAPRPAAKPSAAAPLTSPLAAPPHTTSPEPQGAWWVRWVGKRRTAPAGAVQSPPRQHQPGAGAPLVVKVQALRGAMAKAFVAISRVMLYLFGVFGFVCALGLARYTQK